MERKVEVVPAMFGHVNQIAPHVRECDVAEIWAQTHMDPKAALDTALVLCPESYACLLNGTVVALFGVLADETGRNGTLWMIGTDDIYDNADLFHKHTAQWLEHFRGRFDRISNWVDARNRAAVKWIGSVGFRVDDPVPHGPDQIPFHYFEWRAA